MVNKEIGEQQKVVVADSEKNMVLKKNELSAVNEEV